MQWLQPKNVRLGHIVAAMMVAVALSGAGLVTVGWLIQSRVGTVAGAWHDFKRDNAPRAQILLEIRDILGYGGMIHRFKNFVLRQDLSLARATRQNLGAAMLAVEHYRELGVTDAEAQALADFETVLTAYEDGLTALVDLAAEGRTAAEIDAVVKVDDGPALRALEFLDRESRTVESGGQTSGSADVDRTTKTELLGALKGAMGYGGMIHQFKNLVIRRDLNRADIVRARYDDALAVLTRYRAAGLTATEEAALVQVEQVLTSYHDQVSVVERLVGQGLSAEDIDGTVKINDRPAYESMAVLTAAIRNQQADQARRVDAMLMDIATMTSRITWGTGVWVLAFVALFFLTFRQLITRPVDRLTNLMERLAQGDKAIAVDEMVGGSEIGRMANAVAVFKRNAEEVERLEAEQASAKQQAETERRQAMVALADRFEDQVRGVADGVTESARHVQQTAESMTAIAEETSGLSATVAGAAEQAHASVETVAAAAEELSASIREISSQVANSLQIARTAVAEADRTDKRMTTLTDAAQKIGEVVQLISEIAAQTNLLALNATIEAARAGDAGKGFAVVAGEVKSLATQTARATDDIAAQVANIQSITGDTNEAIKIIGKVINEVNEITTTIASAVEEQGAATQEIARNVHEATHGTGMVTETIGQVTDAADRARGIAGDLLGMSNGLIGQSDQLGSNVDQFLAQVRAG